MKTSLAIWLLFTTCILMAQTNQMADWTRTGSRVGMPFRLVQINATSSPYNADPTGATDSTTAFANAISALSNGYALFIPNGTYKVSGSGIAVQQNNITIRGDSNTVISAVGSGLNVFAVGKNGIQTGVITDYIYAGATNGSSNIVLTAAASFTVGTIVGISQDDVALGSPSTQIINVHSYTHNIQEQCVCTAIINGTNVTLSDPLSWNYTNGACIMAYVGGVFHGIGFENITITQSNLFGGANGNYSFSIEPYGIYDSWFTNVNLYSAEAYTVGDYFNCHCTWQHCSLRYSQGVGADHGGQIRNNVSWNRYQDDIYADGLQPGIEFDASDSDNATMGCFFTNCIIDIDCHNTHPIMDLWDGNVCAGYFESDGYFGGCSHQTLLRNAVASGYIPLLIKRFNGNFNIVGNVLGNATNTYAAYTSTNNNPAGNYIALFGYPNIGNNSYNGNTPPSAWNYPISSYPGADNTAQTYNFPILTLSGAVNNSTTLSGNFSAWTTTMTADAPSTYVLYFQDATKTNLFYPTNGSPVWATVATSTGATLNAAITLPAGCNVFVGGQNAYQQIQLQETNTFCFSNNYDYFNKSVMNSGPMTNSLLYGNTAPAWWGTNRWPAIDPQSSPMVTMIPAQARYLGVGQGGGGGNPPGTGTGTFSMRLFIP